MKENDLTVRLFNFSVETIKYLRLLPNAQEYKVIKNQLTKSVTSTGANYEESQAGVSRADFHNKILIALKELRESNYWLRLIKAIYKEEKKLTKLVNESEELKKILGTIANKTNKK
jgi:four helix bundle protein